MADVIIATMRSLKISAPRIFAILLAMAVLFPAGGPIIDHHFAERQPGHLHLGAADTDAHIHAYESDFHHVVTYEDIPGQSVAIYRYDRFTVSVPAVVLADRVLASMMSFEPSSIFLLPITVERRLAQHVEAPPGKPPPPLL